MVAGEIRPSVASAAEPTDASCDVRELRTRATDCAAIADVGLPLPSIGGTTGDAPGVTALLALVASPAPAPVDTPSLSPTLLAVAAALEEVVSAVVVAAVEGVAAMRSLSLRLDSCSSSSACREV